MIIYEVNLSINKEVASEYLQWLKPHIVEMLTFDGFTTAHLYKCESDSPKQIELIAHYHVESQEQLNHYLTTGAKKMRQDGLSKFKDKFTATRRVLEQQKINV